MLDDLQAELDKLAAEKLPADTTETNTDIAARRSM
jgi:hypothetical protein